jgi:hypothetical protein
MTSRMAALLAEVDRENRAYKKALAKLTPYQRSRWAAVEEANEWFDGESGIALGYLESWLAKSGGKTK